MKPLVESYECRSRAHCQSCRNKDGGRAWREAVGAFRELPGGVVDFECPNGIQWGGGEPPVVLIPTTPLPFPPGVVALPDGRLHGLGDVVAIVARWFGFKRSGCGGCSSRRSWLNRWFPFDWIRRLVSFFWRKR